MQFINYRVSCQNDKNTIVYSYDALIIVFISYFDFFKLCYAMKVCWYAICG
ncbi:hypothetical protein HMPREF3208_00612 [Gardnerella vaginalis]|uniref:Uncharacterized protein n=1 Tax=Gardnerella vaginalis TaxID=2702 RepID=A0A133NYE8_GARVA|nr:hypothetical protein HMPREF3208_00612 [Gardnerella vaginalis]